MGYSGNPLILGDKYVIILNYLGSSYYTASCKRRGSAVCRKPGMRYVALSTATGDHEFRADLAVTSAVRMCRKLVAIAE